MGRDNDVEKAARLWRHLSVAAKKLPPGPEQDKGLVTAKNALRTLGIAVDAAEAHEKWATDRLTKAPDR